MRTILITIDSKPYTTLSYGPETMKPYLHPLRSASGRIVTRRYPMETVAGETHDHPHHRGLWFSHGDLNGYDDRFVRRPVPMMFDEEEPEFDLWKYWFIVRKHLYLIGATFAVAMVIAFYVILTAIPLYTSETVVLIKPKIPDMIGRDGGAVADESDYISDNYYKTQETILSSRSLAAKVVQDLDLAHDGAFMGDTNKGSQAAQLARSFRSYTGLTTSDDRNRSGITPAKLVVAPPPKTDGADRKADGASRDGSVNSGLVNYYLGMLHVSIETGTSLVSIWFSTPDPEQSRRLADAHARAYARLGIEMHDQANQEAERFLQSKMGDLRNRLESSEVELNNYRREHDIIPGLMSLDGKETVVVERLQTLGKELTDAELERIGLEAQVQLINNKKFNALPAVTSNGAIQTLQATLNTQYSEIASLSQQAKPEYPPLAQMEAKAAKTRESLSREIQQVVASIQSGYQVAIGKESELRAELDAQKQTALHLNDAAVKYAMLQREVDTNRELMNNVLQKMKDVGLEAESEASNVSVLDRAEVPLVRSSPRKGSNLVEGAVAGLGGGLFLAFVVEYLSGTLTSPDKAEKLLELPNLGIDPEFTGAEREVQALPTSSTRLLTSSPPSSKHELINGFKSYSMVAEAYRAIRTGLLLSRGRTPPKVILVTSAMRGEGKTVTTVNTARTLAQLGARVLLIDADMRRGRCHRVLELSAGPGLSEALIGAAPVQRLIRPSGFGNFEVLTAGSPPPNSTELVGSNRMQELLAEVSTTFDFVLIDSPPLLPCSDAMVLATMVDGAVLVVDSTRTPKKQIKAARMRLDYAGARIFGFVINRLNPKSLHYHYYYGAYDQKEEEADAKAG